MNTKKAIELLTLCEHDAVSFPTEDLRAATKLGIEALKLVKELRDGSHDATGLELPGETED